MFKKISITLVLSLLLASCGQDNNQIQGTMNNEGSQFPITVHVFDNRMQMQQAIDDMNTRGDEVDGFSAWYLSPGDDMAMTRCDLYVVRPSGVRDRNQLRTWGHELAHCVYGTYHVKGQR